MNDFATVWHDAGDTAEAEQAQRALATAKQASVGVQQFLFLAKSREEFGHRVALAEDRLLQAAVDSGVSVEALLGEYEREFGLLMEAAASAEPEQKVAAMPPDWGLMHESDDNGPRTCPGCHGSRAVPAQGHESYHEVSNGQVRCPTCAGHGVLPQRQSDVGEPLPYSDPGDAQDDWYKGDYLASLKTALQEGQDPLLWLEQEGAGEGQAEKPSEAGIEALEGGKAEATKKEAFDWLKKEQPAAPAADPLAGRAQCPGCGTRTTKAMPDDSGMHKCFQCDGLFHPKTGMVTRPF